MTRMVQVTVAGGLAEAKEIQTILHAAGIECQVEQAVEHHPTGLDDAPQRVLVAESELEAAQDAIESLTDPDEFIGDE